MGPRPVHIYVVNPTREVWTHSDVDGSFDVIAIADIAAGDVTQLNATNVPVRLNMSSSRLSSMFSCLLFFFRSLPEQLVCCNVPCNPASQEIIMVAAAVCFQSQFCTAMYVTAQTMYPHCHAYPMIAVASELAVL